jgi:hypothetical protein
MAKRKMAKQRKQVRRQTRHFQLRVDHPQDTHVREILDYAKSQRREVTLIRDAVALYWALEQGDLSALFEKFPQYKERLNGRGSGVSGSELAKEIAAQIILQGSTPGYMMQSAQPSLIAPAPETTPSKLISGFKPLAAPVEEDDDLPTLTLNTSKSVNDSTANLVNCMLGLQQH